MLCMKRFVMRRDPRVFGRTVMRSLMRALLITTTIAVAGITPAAQDAAASSRTEIIGIKLETSSTQVDLGSQFDVNVRITVPSTLSPPLSGYLINVNYDSGVFEFVPTTGTSCTYALSGSCELDSSGAGTIAISTLSGAISSSDSAGLKIATIKLRAKTPTSSASTISIDRLSDFSDSFTDTFSAVFTDVAISVRDTGAPTINEVASSASGYKHLGDSIPILITFSKPVTSTASASLSLNSGGTATCPAVTATSTMSCVYTVGANQTANPLNYSSTGSLTTSGTIKDTSNNSAVLTLPALGTSALKAANIVVDTTAPTVALTYSSATPKKSGASLTITATFSEAMTSAPTIAISGANQLSATAMTSTSSTVWTYTHTVGSGDGTATVAIAGTDLAGNPNATASNNTFVVDNTAPTVALAYSDGGTANQTGPYKSGNSVTVTANFTETNALADTPTLRLVAGTFTGGTLPSVTLASSSGKTYTGTFTVPSGNGTVTATVSATDTAGNTLAATSQTGFTIDNVAPTVTSVSFSDGGSSNATGPYKSGDSVTATVVVAEDDQLASAPTLTLVANGFTGGSLPALTLARVSTGTYTVRFTVPSGNGAVLSTVAATDRAGNALSLPGQTGFTVDNTAPTVTLAFSDGGATYATGPYKQNDNVTVTVTFVETVGLAGTPTLNLSSSVSTLNSALPPVTLIPGVSANEFTGSFAIPAGDGTVTASVTASDTAGNSVAASGLAAFVVDNTPPASFTPLITSPLAVMKNGDTMLFGASGIAESGLTLVSANLVVYDAASLGTQLTSTPLTVGSEITLSGTSISGSKTVSSFGAGLSAELAITVRDGAGNERTSTSARKSINNPATATVGYALIDHGASAPSNAGDYSSAIIGAINGVKDVAVQLTITSTTTVVGTPTFGVRPSGQSSPTDVVLTQTSDPKVWRGVYDVPNSGGDGAAAVVVGLNNVHSGGDVTLLASQVTTFTIDNTAPTVSSIVGRPLVSSNTTTELLKAGTPTFAVTFSEPVTIASVTANQFAVAGGSGILGTAPTVAAVTPETTVANATSATTFVVKVGLAGTTGDGSSASSIRLRMADSLSISDVPGNLQVSSSASSTFAYLLDTTNPTPGAIEVVNGVSGSGFLAVGSLTPSIRVAGVIDAGGVATAKLQVRRTGATPCGTSANWTDVTTEQNSTQAGTQTFTFAVPAGKIATDGTCEFQAIVTDKAGNTSTSSPLVVTIDTTAPGAVITYKAYLDSDANPPAPADITGLTAAANGDRKIAFKLSFTDLTPITFGSAPTATVQVATRTFPVTLTAVSGDPNTYVGSYDVPSGTDVDATVAIGLTGIVDAVGHAATEAPANLHSLHLDNTAPTFSATTATTAAWYAAETPAFAVSFSEPVLGVASSSFTLTHGPSVVIGANGDPSISSIGSECLQNVPVRIGLKGATGDGTASSTFILTFVSTTGITDCAGNPLSSLASATVASGTFILYPGARPAATGGGGGGSNNDTPAPVVRPPAPAVVPVPPANPAVAAPPPPPPPPGVLGAGPAGAAVAAAFAAISPAQAQAIGSALAGLPPQAAQGFGTALGGAGAQAAGALLSNLAALPAEQVAAVANVAGSIPAEAAAALVTTLASLPPTQLAAVADVAASLPASSATQVFAAIASLAQPGAGPVSFAPPAAVQRSATGQETVSFELGDDTAPSASNIESAEVAGVHVAVSSRRTVVVLIKPGQVGVINRPKSGVWPDVALPVTAGAQAGLTPVFAIPSDATSFSFEPTPSNLNLVQQGSLGGGAVIPLGSPFAVRVTAPTSAAETVIGVQMPSIPVAKGEAFAYLFSTGGGTGPGFTGYLRAPAEFDAPTGRQKWNLRVDEATDVLFLPVALQPAFVSNFVEDAHIYSSAFDGAVDFGPIGEQFSTLTVVAPQVAGRIYVYNPETKGYGWVNANEVGPASPPAK